MQAYATAARLPREAQLRRLDPVPQASGVDAAVDPTLVDALLGRLADLVVQRLVERMADSKQPVEEWLDARDAAEYLGVHRDTLRKLAAQRAIPAHQEGAGCKLYFRRDELDDWRRTSRAARRVRAVA